MRASEGGAVGRVRTGEGRAVLESGKTYASAGGHANCYASSKNDRLALEDRSYEPAWRPGLFVRDLRTRLYTRKSGRCEGINPQNCHIINNNEKHLRR